MWLNKNDLVKGAVIAALGVILGMLEEALGTHGLNFMAYQWGAILSLAAKAGGLYLFKNLLTNKEGKVLGVIQA